MEGCEGTYTFGKQCIDQSIIKIQSPLVHLPGSLRHDAGPGKRESVCSQIEFGHERDIFFHVMIMIRCNLTCFSQKGSSRCCRKDIPYRNATTVFTHRTFNLVS